MLLLEIALTIAAWKKGWGAKALLPAACVLGGGFVIGLVIGAGGAKVPDANDMRGAALLIDLFMIGALIRMAIRGPRPADVQSFTQAADVTGAPATASVGQ